MNFREITQADIDYCAKNGLYARKYANDEGPLSLGWTLEHRNDVLAIGGFLFITNTTAWAWIELSQASKQYVLESYRVIKEWMEIACEEKKIVRLQAWVDPEFEAAIRTVEHLGFFRESTMRDFLGKGKPAFLYVKLFQQDNEVK